MFSSIFSISLHYSKIWKKGKLNSEQIQKIWKKSKLKSERIWEIQKKGKLNNEKDMENTEEKLVE
jgi:hypothetical protein